MRLNRMIVEFVSIVALALISLLLVWPAVAAQLNINMSGASGFGATFVWILVSGAALEGIGRTIERVVARMRTAPAR